jgi:toxin ParE1/3/4
MTAQRWRVRLSAQAERDFASILQWTAENFGAQQASTYQATIVQSIRELALGPDIRGARKRDDIGRGAHTLHVARHGRRGRHLLLYRVAGVRTIEIGRILHDSMELRRHVLGAGEEDNT